MEQEFQKSQETNNFEVDFEIPDISGALVRLDESIRAKEKLRDDHDKKNSKKKGKAKKRRSSDIVCCCGNPHCGVGPMMETQG